MKNLCIIGASGLLGRSLLSAAAGRYRLSSVDVSNDLAGMPPDITCCTADISHRNEINAALASLQPDFVVNAAALTDVDYCEDVPEKAYGVNGRGAGYAAEAAETCGAHFIQISTDYVFNGQSGPYTENDVPDPLSVYGKSKYEGEVRVLQVNPSFAVVRTMILFGHAPGIQQNFVTWLISMLTKSQKVKIVNDQYGTPTYAPDLAAAVISLLESGKGGVFHAAGPEMLNRYEFALKTVRAFGLQAADMSEVTSEEFVQKAPRPMRSGLLTEKLTAVTGYCFPSLSVSLADMRTAMEGEEK